MVAGEGAREGESEGALARHATWLMMIGLPRPPARLPARIQSDPNDFNNSGTCLLSREGGGENIWSINISRSCHRLRGADQHFRSCFPTKSRGIPLARFPLGSLCDQAAQGEVS